MVPGPISISYCEDYDMEVEKASTSSRSTLPVSLLEVLSLSLVLHQTAPYIPVQSLLALGATSKDFRDLVYKTPNAFRYLDLTQVKSAQSDLGSIDTGGQRWRNVQLDENVTEDESVKTSAEDPFSLYAASMEDLSETMILDGLAVPADLVSEIITDESFNIRILSIRDVQHLNERKLQQALLYSIRTSRPENTPKLRGIYIFGPKRATLVPRVKRHVNVYPPGVAPIDTMPTYRGITALQGAQIGAEWNKKSQEALEDEATRNRDLWFAKSGKIFPKLISSDWSSTIHACRGLISFDLAECHGVRHKLPSKGSSSPWYTRPEFHLAPQAATHALEGCSGCNSAPEGLSRFGHASLDRFPLLAPVHMHSSTIKSAKAPFQSGVEKKLLIRCMDCLKSRYCESCHKWWCEDCYEITVSQDHKLPDGTVDTGAEGSIDSSERHVKFGAIRSCYECGFNCNACINRTQRVCGICGGGYCLIHNEGSTLTTCDWCARSGRRTRELY